MIFNLEEINFKVGSHDNVKKILDGKKKKVFYQNENDNNKTYDDEIMKDQLDYIFDPRNNIRKEHTKNNKTSCKCLKTQCSKYFCSCLKNGQKCDILCSCKSCYNK